jgi:hypothetical protein
MNQLSKNKQHEMSMHRFAKKMSMHQHMILLSSHQPQLFKKPCATILFNFEMEDDHRHMHGKDAYGFLYYFIQHRI